MKVLITGANGQLGYALQKTSQIFAAQYPLELIMLTRAQIDLMQLEFLPALLDQYAPDVIINAAAYTAVDKAEAQPELAKIVNALAVQTIAHWCQSHKKLLVHISTDFVFDGKKSSPYEVLDTVNPLSVYGKTKQLGEMFALRECSSTYVVRTGWVYCEQGNNFVKTMLRLAAERPQLSIVADQIGTPTYALHLAEMIWQLVLRRPPENVWHFSDAGVASWYDFAVAIVEEANVLGLLPTMPNIMPIATQDYPTPAQRPAYSVLNKAHTWSQLQITPTHWRAALSKMLIAYKTATCND